VIPFVLFWGSASLLGYVVAGFPALVMALSRVRPKPFTEADITPSLTVIVAAHDEASVIGDKLRNLLATAYRGPLQVIVASDGSTDGTVAAVEAVGDGRVEVLDLPRVGKARALNAAVERATGEVLVFTDANSMLAPTSLGALVRPLADPGVGGVAGNQVYAAAAGDGLGERAHWNLDRRLKLAESRVGNAISATGALYAIRAELFAPVVEGVTDDFYTSTGVISRGKRLVFAPDAIATEAVAVSGDKELQRKQRVMTRGFQSLRARRELLDPRRTGFYAIELWTYKVLRRLLTVPLVVMTLTAPLLWRRGRLYRLAALGQGGFWALAATGLAARHRRIGRHPLLALPAFAVAGMWASLRALVNVLTGRSITVWDTTREPAGDRAA
jgi:glycosyltransferase involved in cell wall biosynthesis